MLQKRAFLSGESCGMILLDMESAFYKAVRQLLVRNKNFEATDEYCAHMSSVLGIGPEEHGLFYQHLRAETMLQRAQANKAIQRWVLSSMEGSWCKLRSSQQCLATSLGTKPGDPTADVLYSLVMTKFLNVSKKEFQKMAGFAECGEAMTWVDDVIVPYQDKADRIYQKTSKILEVLHNTATSLGMIPNLKPGKTEVVLGFAGEGAQGSKRNFEKGDPQVPFDTVRGPKVVEVVSEATYLGAILESKGRLMPEIITCTGKALNSVKPLKKAVLTNDKVENDQKRAIVQSLALSKASYTIGSWLPMRRVEERAWKVRVMRIFRLFIRHKNANFEHVTDEEILVQFGLLSPREMISMATLRTCAMLAQWADDAYLQPFYGNLSMHESMWTKHAVDELNQVTKKIETGWKHLENFEGAIKALRDDKALKRMNKTIAKYTKVLLHERKQIWLIRTNHPRGEMRQTAADKEDENSTCLICNRTFGSASALGVHGFKAHGIFCEAYSYAASTTCFACHGQYHSRERLVQHIQWGSMGCLERLRHLVEPLTREQIVFLNAKDKEQYTESKRQGRRRENQKKTFCREYVMDITEVTGDWNEYFDRRNMTDQELGELQELEDWAIDGPLLELYEELPNESKLHEILELFEKKCGTLKSAKICLLWSDMVQKDLQAAYDGADALSGCMVSWANTRSRVVSRFF